MNEEDVNIIEKEIHRYDNFFASLFWIGMAIAMIILGVVGLNI